mgnify:CR=1 FL=1
MDDKMRETIEARIKQLKDEQLQVVQKANQQIAAYNGAISELERLIMPRGKATPVDANQKG